MSFSLRTPLSILGLTVLAYLSGCAKETEPTASQDNSLTATAPATGEASTLSERNALARLTKTLEQHFKTAKINAKITSIQPTEIPNIYWVNLENMSPIFVTGDGQYIIQGDVIRLGDKRLHNISETLLAGQNKILLQDLKVQDLIVYPASSKTKHVVYVFTDISCPYCQKFHEHMDEFNKKGVEVRYLAWPRGNDLFPAMESIWCSKDRQAAFDLAIHNQPIESARCANPVKSQHNLGVNMGVNGTPAVYNVEGEYLGGYMSPTELLERLNN